MRLTSAILTLALALPSAALAQDEPWPTQTTVRLIAASGPGGNPDVLARLLAEKFTNTFGKPFIVERTCRARAALSLANMVAKAPPDGHVLMFGDSGAMAINPALNPNLGYDPIKDFTPVTALVSLPTIFRQTRTCRPIRPRNSSRSPRRTWQDELPARQGPVRSTI